MAKLLAPEVLALIPDGIENLILRCVICAEPLPASRRSIGDHAGACHKVRVLYRRYMIKLSKCISCLHPSTAAQREEFKQWRRARGDIRDRGGRPKSWPLIGGQLPEKTLDNPDLDFATPDIAVSPSDGGKNPQGIVAKTGPLGSPQTDDLGRAHGSAWENPTAPK